MLYSYTQGSLAFKKGHSIHYNPYRNKGLLKDYEAWISGWKSQSLSKP